MADALVSFMLEKLATVTLDAFQQEVSLVVGAEKEVENLKTTFKFIQAVLNDAEQRQIKDEAVKLWLEEFKDVAYDMDDVLDEWSYEMHKSQNDTGGGEGSNKKKKVITSSSSYLCSLCSCFTKVAVRHNIGTQIIKINERLDQAEKEKNRFGLVQITSNDHPIERLKSSSLVDVTDIIGRVTDKETIMSKLIFLNESSTSTTQSESNSTQALHAPNIISIVGMGGLGKTTLAQLVFHDDQVKTHFEKTMWVCVSDPLDLVTVTKAIIEEAKCEVPKSSEWNTLHRSLSESIKGKRFLLVLDDVWTDDRTIWEPLEVSFKSGAKGSRILVTTRNEKVALMMNATYVHSLGMLSDNDCSLLLSRIALAGRKKEKHEELKEICKKISKKCKGLPLAAKTLGGLLHFKNNKKEWLSILESEFWKLEEFENGFLKPALLLSYYDLPLPLKGCFVYCSIFPKDYKMEKDLLVKLWMAQGFLNPRSTNEEELEMIGEDYFNNLVMRSFFQDFTKDDNGDIISCKMHDLVHDFAQFLTKNKCYFTQINGTQFLNSSSRVRHLTLVPENKVGNSTDCFDHFISSSVFNAKKLRTLQILREGELTIKEAPADLFRRFRCLKVLCLNEIHLENLSGEIGNLIHLRYLDLSRNSSLKILPETISNLSNLQTLKLEGCWSLCELPREMRRMINLRHLDLRNTYELSYIPQGIGGLTCLKTLSDFVVGGGASEEGCKISELRNLKLLQGELRIRGLGRVETVNEALEIQMKQKQLHSLELGFEHNEEEETENDELLSKKMEDVLEVLEPHPDVVELGVYDYMGFKLSRWMESTSLFLSNMKTLELWNCINLTKFPAFGQLPSLEVLDIRRAIKVKHIGFEFYSNSSTLEHVNCRVVPFPKLKELRMVTMDNLEVWELQHGVVMPCLRLIQVDGCPRLKALPALGKLPSLEELDIRGAEELKHIGCEFLYDEVDDEEEEEEEEEAGGGEVLRFNNNNNNNRAAFPKLKTLKLKWFGSKELEWELNGGVIGGGGGGSGGKEIIIIMPCLREVHIWPLYKNWKSFVEVLSKMPSLEVLSITGEATEFIKYIRHDDDLRSSCTTTTTTARERIILFPNLKTLELVNMEDMEELKIGGGVMPLLNSLTISRCNKLKAIQVGSLESLVLYGCASSVYELGIPNLKRLETVKVPIHPEAFATTTLQATLEELTIDCSSWTCVPEQVQQLTNLRKLVLVFCSDELVQRCRKDEGEDWRIIFHIPNIYLNDRWIINKPK